MTNWTRGPLLGRGSTAIVSLASDLNSGQLFAVKSTSHSHSEFLQYEKSIHSSISSPHIISYLGYDSDDHFYNLFLEYAPGGSISDLIQKQKLLESEIRSFVKDILLGLRHLHSMKVAHCDIKCQNILICCDGKTKIADLGCAKYIGSDNQIRAKIRGTPMFMAPEVARGEEQGLASDVWALGCSIIEMATGRAPWSNVSDAGSLLYRVGFTDDVPEIPEWISDSCKDFLCKCLVKDAGKRSTVDELLMHPFFTGTGLDIEYKRVTPKSILDNSVWDSVSESEAVASFGSNRIMDLIGFGDGPDWSWNDSWQTVRNESLFTSVSVVASTSNELSEVTFDDELWDYSEVNYMYESGDGAVDAIVKVLTHGLTWQAKENAAAAVVSLSAIHSYRKRLGRNTELVESLVNLANEGPVKSKKDALSAILSLTGERENIARLVKKNVVETALELISNPDLADESASILAGVIKRGGAQEVGAKSGVVMKLVRVLKNGSESAREHAAAALVVLCRKVGGIEMIGELVKVPGIEWVIWELMGSGTERGRRKAASLGRICRRWVAAAEEAERAVRYLSAVSVSESTVTET